MKPSSYSSSKLIAPNMTPLIDVVFLLLVFFLYAVMHMAEIKGVSLSLPTSQQAEKVISTPVSIEITADGIVSLEGSVLSPEEIVPLVSGLPGINAERKILIQADRESRTGIMVDVMGRLKHGGYENVTLAVEVP